ncbi:DUF1206 domain-containing protein [Hymenobacter saemangeumensis]|uniref:DUF1206 domain-containing protein n=1 Tax=Hymenobacter saemangeumensis TaxID=1084522 RepID=A0ABP8IR45_9BACT
MNAADTLRSAVPHSPTDGIKTMARLGFAAIGIVYVLMGMLALLAALGQREGALTDREEAVNRLQDVPGGNILLGLIAFGLLGYIIWRFTQAIRDTEDKGHGAKGLGMRIWYVISGLFYSGLALYAARLAMNGHAEKGGNTSQSLVAKVLNWPGGNWLILAIGLVMVGIGIYHAYRAFSGRFRNDVNSSSLSETQQRMVYRAGQIGFTARAIVLGILGYFLVQAGWESRAKAVGNTGKVFDFLATMGPLVLGAVSAGLVAYGIYMLVQARYPVLRGI